MTPRVKGDQDGEDFKKEIDAETQYWRAQEGSFAYGELERLSLRTEDAVAHLLITTAALDG